MDFEELKLRIKDGIDLVGLVEEYVPLRSRGRYHVGLCPFHQEKTPSFTVYTDSAHFHCYGCGEAGDVFSFLMKRDGFTFREAMEHLADRLGLSTEGVFSGSRDGANRRREDVQATLPKVRDWFRSELAGRAGAAARDYLVARGLDAATERFGLGFHPAGGRLQQLAADAGLSRQVLEQAGLLGADGFERFAGRLMFPIEDERGRILGFGGRVLDAQSERAKYLNSPESPFFNKRRLLFGLNQAKKAGVRRLIVMEGYTDVIAAHLAGFEGAVATLGTALTTDHAQLLVRYATEGVVLVFDGDRAGRQAADRAFRELIHTQLPVSIALLAEGTDPADLISATPDRDEEDVARGRENLQGILDRADDALTVWFRLQHDRMDLTLDVNVARVAGECGRILSGVEDPVRREALGRRMAQHLGLQEESFLRLAAKVKPRRTASRSSGPNPGSRRGPAPAQSHPLAADAAFGAEEEVGHDLADAAREWDAATPVAGSRGPAAANGAPPASVDGSISAAGPEDPQPEDPQPEDPQPEDPQPEDPQLAQTDLDLLACLLAGPDLIGEVDGVTVTFPAIREILDMFREGAVKGSVSKEQITRYLFMRCAERSDLATHLASCLDRAEHIKSPSDTLLLLLKDRSAHASRNQAQNIRFRLQQARAKGDAALVATLTQEYLDQLRQRTGGRG